MQSHIHELVTQLIALSHAACIWITFILLNQLFAYIQSVLQLSGNYSFLHVLADAPTAIVTDALGIYTTYIALNAHAPVGVPDEMRQMVEGSYEICIHSVITVDSAIFMCAWVTVIVCRLFADAIIVPQNWNYA